MRKYSRIIIFMIVSSIIFLVPQVQADGDDYLSQSYIWQGQGEYVADGIGMWGQGGSSASGYITISDIPAGATIEKAFLYWSTWQENNPPVTSITINGNQISEELIGTITEADAWYPNTPHTYRGYRADISSIVIGNGNYQVSGFPTGTVYDNQQTMGASIVVVYSLPTKPFVTIIINDGMAALHNRPQSYTTTISGFTAPASPNAKITFIAGQAESNWNEDWEYFNGMQLAQNGLDGSDGPLWDTDSYDVSPYISQGEETATVEVSMVNDWIGWVAAIFQIDIPLITEVSIDIKPGSDPNSFNNDGNGVVPVAVLGNMNFDVREINPDTVMLEGLAIRAVGKGNKLLAHYEDVNGDGYEDLVVQIEDSNSVFQEGCTIATLSGNLIDGTLFEGTDEICIVP